MNMNARMEKISRPQDAARAHQLFLRIEEVLSDARLSGMEQRHALSAVRQMMHAEFADLKVIHTFTIEDPQGFMMWRVDVTCPDGRPIEVVHDTFERKPFDLAPLKATFAAYPNILRFIDFQAKHNGRPVLEKLAQLGPLELDMMHMTLEDLDQSVGAMFRKEEVRELADA